MWSVVLNGDAEGLASWILYLRDNPQQAEECGCRSRDFLLRTASPEIVTAQYLDLIQRHLPDGKSLASLS